ncbi:unnamed protein product [Litomosoides sigmodontis]|uniref:Uncharacterized protein n=1 Tax=Litomosoides sigmodontis TaxID=42156 RepID=A0A3P6T0R2_LITSI|nr:unnamed protein product [Litomosoides sigmodontis]
MDGNGRALYSYSWQQSPINKRRRANPPEEEKKIFDDWFEEKADEYFPWIRDQGLDNETIRAANASWTSYSLSCSPEVCKACVSPMILERLQRPKQNQKTLAEERMRKKAEGVANITRYERSLVETRKTIDRIKTEKQRKLMFSKAQHQGLSSSMVFPEHSAYRGLNEVSPFQNYFFKEQATVNEEKLESKLRSNSFSSTRSTTSNNIEERVKQSASSESEKQTSIYHKDDDSDNELLRLAFESSPIQKSKSAPRIAANEDDLSDEALLAIMASSPVRNPKLKKNKLSADPCQSCTVKAIHHRQVRMNRVRDTPNAMINATGLLVRNQSAINYAMHPNTSVSYDSGIDVGMNTPVGRMSRAHPLSNYDISMTEIMMRRLHIMSLPSGQPNNTEDENKENISPFPEPDRNVRESTPSGRNQQPENMGNIVRFFSRSMQRVNHSGEERERSGFLPAVTQSASLHSPLRLPELSPIRATPRHSSIRRRARTVATEEAADFASLEDLPEISPFGPNGTPPRTPSPVPFAGVGSDSGHGNSSEVLANVQSTNEHTIATAIANMTTGTGFVTPLSRPLQPPMAPRKKRVDNRSLRSVGSPSFFPKSMARLRFKGSHTMRLVPSPTDINTSTMVLRSALKPRRSKRTKRMPSRYNCDTDRHADLRKKPRKT